MSPSRRGLLQTVTLGIATTLAGCAGEQSKTTTTRTTTDQTLIDRETTGQTTAETTTDQTTETTTETTTSSGLGQAIEFAHRNPVLKSGVADRETWYYARVFADERETTELDVSSASIVAGQTPETVREFVAGTDFEKTALFALQAEVESPEYGLEFDFVDEGATPTQVVGNLDHLDNGDNSDRGEDERDSAISTLLVRVPSRLASNSLVTLAERPDVRSERLPVTETFRPPNEEVYESVNVEDFSTPPNENLGVPSGARVTTADAAEQFTPNNAQFSEFVNATNFEEDFLLGLQTRIGANAYYLWPTAVESDGSEVSVQLRRGYGGALNAEVTNFLLARIPREGKAPERGTATVRQYNGRNGPTSTRTISLSSDPDDWQNSTTRT